LITVHYNYRMAKEVEYLTVQDHLWINLQVTGKKSRFKFAQLEEAVYYQYAYGRSTNVLAQAARYASGFAKKAPFETGNLQTGFVGLLTFLNLNGYQVKLADKDAAEFIESLLNSPLTAEQEISRIAKWHDDDDHHVSIKEAATAVMDRYSRTIKKLGELTAVS